MMSLSAGRTVSVGLLILYLDLSTFIHAEVKNITCISESETVPCSAFTYSDSTNCSIERRQINFPNLYNQNYCPVRSSSKRSQTADQMKDGGNFYVYHQTTAQELKGNCSTRGFELLYNADDGLQRCMIIQLADDVTEGPYTSDIIFKVKLWEVLPVELSPWRLQVTDLPKPPSVISNVTVKSDNNTGFGYIPDVENTVQWSPVVFHYNNSKTRQVSLRMSPPPKEYRISYFIITLRKHGKRNRMQYPQRMLIDKFHHTFYEVKPGLYDLTVEPHDDLYNQKTCRCQKSTKCQRCNRFITPTFEIYEILEADEIKNTTMTTEDNMTDNDVAIRTTTSNPKERSSVGGSHSKNITEKRPRMNVFPNIMKATNVPKLDIVSLLPDYPVPDSGEVQKRDIENGQISQWQTFLLTIISVVIAIIGILAVLVSVRFCFQRHRFVSTRRIKSEVDQSKKSYVSPVEKNAKLDSVPDVWKTLLVLHDESCNEIILHLTAIFRRKYNFAVVNLNHLVVQTIKDNFLEEVETAVQSADFVLLVGLPSSTYLTYLDYCYDKSFHMVLSMQFDRSILSNKTALVCFSERNKSDASTQVSTFKRFHLMKDFTCLLNFLQGSLKVMDVKDDFVSRENLCLKDSIKKYKQKDIVSSYGQFWVFDDGLYNTETDDDGGYSMALTIGEGRLEPPMNEQTEQICQERNHSNCNCKRMSADIDSTQTIEKYETTAKCNFKTPDSSQFNFDVTSEVLMNQMEDINKPYFPQCMNSISDMSEDGISI